MDYRIIIKTEASGKKLYYVQYKFLFFFWKYYREICDISMYSNIIYWNSLKDAQEFIKKEKKNLYKQKQKRIVKKEIINNII
jgi:hypothetical protein